MSGNGKNGKAVWDFTQFHNRLRVKGTLRLKTSLRVGAGRSTAADEVDLPVVKDEAERPYIPGSSFKGALRAHTEALLRALDAQRQRDPDKDPALACLSVSKPEKGISYAQAGCLTTQLVKEKKEKLADDPARLDRELWEESCWTCQVFGAPWLASRVLVKDLTVQPETWFRRYQLRDGVAIDRDTETASEGKLYQFEAVPVGTCFNFELVAENLTLEEQGLLFLGLRAFERGQVPLGGARSRGLGWVELADLKVEETPSALALVKGETRPLDEAERKARVDAFLKKVGVQNV
jgi:CRISPR-associated RAMP protein (TIGR02581 family)